MTVGQFVSVYTPFLSIFLRNNSPTIPGYFCNPLILNDIAVLACPLPMLYEMDNLIIILSITVLSLTISLDFADHQGNGTLRGLSIEKKAELVDTLRVYRKHCGSCHGSNATGGRASNLTDGRWGYGDSDDDIFVSTYEGRSAGYMPQMKGRITEDEAWRIVFFLRFLEGVSST
jgi:hypothetical protein